MSSGVTVFRPKASREEVLANCAAIRQLIATLGLDGQRVRADGTIIVHTNEGGYRAVARLSSMASDIVGKDVHVITDDVPGAAVAQGF